MDPGRRLLPDLRAHLVGDLEFLGHSDRSFASGLWRPDRGSVNQRREGVPRADEPTAQLPAAHAGAGARAATAGPEERRLHRRRVRGQSRARAAGASSGSRTIAIVAPRRTAAIPATTNNRMELTALIEAYEALPRDARDDDLLRQRALREDHQRVGRGLGGARLAAQDGPDREPRAGAGRSTVWRGRIRTWSCAGSAPTTARAGTSTSTRSRTTSCASASAPDPQTGISAPRTVALASLASQWITSAMRAGRRPLREVGGRASRRGSPACRSSSAPPCSRARRASAPRAAAISVSTTHRRLRGRVRGESRRAVERRARRDVHDRAALAREHARQHARDYRDRGPNVHAEHAVPDFELASREPPARRRNRRRRSPAPPTSGSAAARCRAPASSARSASTRTSRPRRERGRLPRPRSRRAPPSGSRARRRDPRRREARDHGAT